MSGYSCVKILIALLLYGNENEKHNKTRKADALLIQKLYDYILAHLEEPFLIKVLSSKFGTNEHKLKIWFFRIDVFISFIIRAFQRAFFMIEHTGIPLKMQ
jgi:hypothetical protein